MGSCPSIQYRFLRAHDFSQRRVWITGASDGIGRAVAIELAKKGSQLILSARNQVALEELADHLSETYQIESPLVLSFDVTDKQAYIDVAQKIKDTGGLDIVFLNAGILKFYDIKNFNAEIFEEVINVNYLGMVRGVEAALPLLRRSPYAHIVGMSSLASYGGLPRRHAAYGAAQAAIRNMFEAIRFDLLPEKISVSIVCPGFIKTKLSDQNDFYMPARISAEDAARRIVEGIKKRDYEIHFPKRMSIPSKLLSLAPSRFYTWLMAKLFRVS